MSNPSSLSSPDKRFHALKHSRTLNSLADSIRSLRDPVPLDTKSGSSSVTSSPSSPRITPSGQVFHTKRQSTGPLPLDVHNASPVTNRVDGKYAPRPPLITNPGSEDMTRSPKARFQAFMASSNSDYSSQRFAISPSKLLGTSPQLPNFLDKRTISSPIIETFFHDSTPPSPVPKSTPSKATEPQQLSTMDQSSPNSAMVEPKSSSPDVRTPTLDSGSSDDTNTNVASVVARAGSAEAAVEQLLKEKQAAAARNEQLWQLVEKQRAMILGLNKDLEIALQDKEKYWRRLKDQPVKTVSESGYSQRPSTELQQPDPHVQSVQSKHLPNGLTRLATASELTNASPRQTGLPLTPESAESIDRQMKMSPALAQHSRAETPWQRGFGEHTTSSPKLKRAASDLSVTPSNPPTPARIMNDSAIASVERARKAPPKPLDLSQPQKPVIARAVNEAALDSESDYSETEDSDVSSWGDRGRRPTREADDRKREVIVMEEENERRSRSGKTKTAKARVEPIDHKTNFAVEIPMSTYRGVDLPAGLSNGIGLPSSPRAPLLGGLQSPMPPSMGSIGSLVTPGERPIPHRVVTAPLMSPGLPATPRPGDRPMNAPQPRMPVKAVKSMASLPSHPSAMGLPFSPTSQQFLSSRHPPLPSPLVQVEAYKQLGMVPPSLAALVQPMNQNKIISVASTLDEHTLIYQGFVSEQYPGLLLAPNALPVIDVKVQSCRLMPLRLNRNAAKETEEDTPFTLGVYSRASGKLLWVIEKTISALALMDHNVKVFSGSSLKCPDKSIFSGQSPAKIDARRTALDSYFHTLLDTAMDEKTALMICGFFSTDVCSPGAADSISSTLSTLPRTVGSARRKKEGYLSKKGKSFGGWKARYFVITGNEVQYYESIGGDFAGSVSLIHAQIARQTSVNTDEAEYRHAFMILETKRKDSSTVNRHILCAETDEERDDWIDALLQSTEPADNDEPTNVVGSTPNGFLAPPNVSGEAKNGKLGPKQAPEKKRLPLIQTVSYDSTNPAESPKFGGNSARASWSPTSTDNASDSGSAASRPHPIQTQVAQIPPAKNSPSMARKKRSIFGFRTKVSDDLVSPPTPMASQSISITNTTSRQDSTSRGVFGIPLAEAAEYHSPNGIDVALPAPVYRCIEYLEQKQAAKEEGIFRLSGSNSTVKALKERFNNEGDVKLLDGQHYDVHAVASVLKLYLRELPESVLTRKLHLDFLRIIDAQEDHRQKIIGVNILVHKLPEANHEILATLSRFLIDIVNNSDVNKMSVRNVGIVFSPTLNIPASLISLFLTDYGAIFGATDDLAASPLIQELTYGPSAPVSGDASGIDSIRSPRKQLFTDLPTPSYQQNGFGSLMQTPSLFSNEQAQMFRLQAGSHVQQDARATYDTTGLMPLKQAYNTPALTTTALRLSAISNASR